MSKKLYAAFVPLLAVVAFAIAPAVAQAAPHWYICKHETTKTHKWIDSACSVESGTSVGEYERVRLPFNEAEKTRVKTFGKLTLTASNGASVTCFVDDHGKIWNKTLAEPGFDEIQAFENYECTSNFCTSGLEVLAEGLPWPTELLAGPTIRVRIGTAPKPVQIRLKCATPATNVLFTGELKPKFVNGTQANGGTSFAEFDAESGELAGGGLTAKVTGKDYLIGVENAEQVLVFNP